MSDMQDNLDTSLPPTSPLAEHGETNTEATTPRSLNPIEFEQLTARLAAQLKNVFVDPLVPREFERRREALREVLTLRLYLPGKLARITGVEEDELQASRLIFARALYVT